MSHLVVVVEVVAEAPHSTVVGSVRRHSMPSCKDDADGNGMANHDVIGVGV